MAHSIRHWLFRLGLRSGATCTLNDLKVKAKSCRDFDSAIPAEKNQAGQLNLQSTVDYTFLYTLTSTTAIPDPVQRHPQLRLLPLGYMIALK